MTSISLLLFIHNNAPVIYDSELDKIIELMIFAGPQGRRASPVRILTDKQLP